MMATAVLESSSRKLVAHPDPRERRSGLSKRRTWRLFWLLVPVGVAAAVWARFAVTPEALSPPPQPAPRSISIGVSALGRLAPEGEVVAVAPGSGSDGGRVERLLVAVGDPVKAGQVIAVLDTYKRREAAVRQSQAQVEVARAKLAQVKAGRKPEDIRAQEALVSRNHAELRATERDLGRAAALLQKAAYAQQEYDDQRLKCQQAQESLNQASAQLEAMKAVPQVDVAVAAAELAQAEAGLLVARADEEATLVRAPLAGRVLRIHARPGERVGDKGVLELGNTTQMHAVAEVYEQDVGRVKVGQCAMVRVPTLGTQMTGEVVRKDLVVSRKVIFSNDPVADIDARVVEVWIRLAPEDSAQVAGLSNARAEVVIAVEGSRQ
jgi:HlyD family secretion protein